MSEWETREAAFEKGLEHESTLRFRIRARRNRLIGLWAAEKLGLEDPEAYAKTLVEDRVAEDDDAALTAWLGEQLARLDPPISGHRIARRIEELNAIAAREIHEGR